MKLNKSYSRILGKIPDGYEIDFNRSDIWLNTTKDFKSSVAMASIVLKKK